MSEVERMVALMLFLWAVSAWAFSMAVLSFFQRIDTLIATLDEINEKLEDHDESK